MIFIVLCHFLQYYEHELAWWFNVGVQIFFFISGFLYAHKTIKDTSIDFIWKNIKKILIPYYSFLIPTIVVYFSFKELLSVKTIASALLCSGTINGLEHLWFISYILLCYIITPYLENWVNKIKGYVWYIFCLYVICGLVLGQMLSFAFSSYFAFNRIFCYLFGYFAGVFLQRYGIKLFKVITGVVVVATILANGFRVYCQYIAHISFTGFGFFASYAHALLGATIVLIPLVYFKPLTQKTILDITDKYSLYVYIVHQLFILSPFTLLTLTNYYVINWIITIVAIIVFAILLKLFAERIEILFSKITFLVKNKVNDQKLN